MHFLAHFSLSPFPTDALFNLGLAIPDMHRRFSRIYNAQSFKNFLPSSDQEASLHRGILAHFHQDHAFHHLPLFEEWMRTFTATFRTIFPQETDLKLFFLEHIGVEFLIDRHIFLAHPERANQFYIQLENVSAACVRQYFDTLGFAESGKWVLERRAWFLENRFLYYFREIDTMMTGILRIYEHSTGCSISASEQKALSTVFVTLDDAMKEQYASFLLLTQNAIHA